LYILGAGLRIKNAVHVKDDKRITRKRLINIDRRIRQSMHADGSVHIDGSRFRIASALVIVRLLRDPLEILSSKILSSGILSSSISA
jgi:hypothetical protein